MAIDFTELNQKLQDEEKELWERLQTVTQLRTSLKAVFGDVVPAPMPAVAPAGVPYDTRLGIDDTAMSKIVLSGSPVPVLDAPFVRRMRRSPVSGTKMPTSELVVYVLKRAGHPMPSAAIAAEVWADSRVPNKPDSAHKVKKCVQSAVHTLHASGIIRKCEFGWELVPGGKNGSL